MSRTFIWRLLHNLLPSEQRLFHLKKTQNPNCILCQENVIDDVWSHSFSSCAFSQPAMNWMLKVLCILDPTMTSQKAVFLQINPINSENILPCVWIIIETLQYIWARRRARDQVDVSRMRATLTAKCDSLSHTKLYRNHATNMK